MNVIFCVTLFTLLIILREVISEEEGKEEEFRLSGLFFGCSKDVTKNYHNALQDFSMRLYKQVARENEDHFVMSQYSVWLALSALAEGSEGEAQRQLFKQLNLPVDPCLREKYYEIALTRESSAKDVTLARKRVLVLGENLKLNSSWASGVRASGLIDTQTIGLKNTEAADNLKSIINGTSDNHYPAANSVLLDSLDYQGLWTMAFDYALYDSYSDFFDDSGKKIGSVDFLKVKRRVKLAYLPLLDAKVVELPVGNYGRYRMIFVMNHGRKSLRSTIERLRPSFILDLLPLMFESLFPLEIAVPQFNMTSDLDLKKALSNIGFDSIWHNPNAAKYVSDPHLQLATFYQRASINIDGPGLSPAPRPILSEIVDIITDIESLFGRKFIANRPFMYGLVDSETRTWLFSGAYSKPGPIAD